MDRLRGMRNCHRNLNTLLVSESQEFKNYDVSLYLKHGHNALTLIAFKKRNKRLQLLNYGNVK